MLPNDEYDKLRKEAEKSGWGPEAREKVKKLSTEVACLLAPIMMFMEKIPEEAKTKLQAGMFMSLIMGRAKSIDQAMGINKERRILSKMCF